MLARAPRLVTLDALRGVAALLVLAFHLRNFGLAPAKSGYLGVDLFFLLSGLVVARSYDTRLQGGMSIWMFARLRVIRLYPLFVLGLFLALFQRSWQTFFADPDALSLGQISITFFLELFMLPSPLGVHMFPLNAPAWSLFFEILINLFYAAVLIQLPIRALRATVVLSALALILVSVLSGTVENGPLWQDFHVGAFRALFAFSTGVFLARQMSAPPRESWLFLLPIALIVVLLNVPPFTNRVFYEMLVVLIALPAVVWMGSVFNPPRFMWKWCEVLGDISYPVYTVHYPLLFLCGWAATSIHLNRFVWIPPFVLLLCALAWALHLYYDVPIRARLAKAFPAKVKQSLA